LKNNTPASQLKYNNGKNTSKYTTPLYKPNVNTWTKHSKKEQNHEMIMYYLYYGDAFHELDRLQPNSIDVCFTSPTPAFNELGYGKSGETPLMGNKVSVHSDKAGLLGTEYDTADYIEHLTAVLEKVKRVLKKSGSLWLQMGDYHYRETGSLLLIPESVASMLVYKYGWILRSKLLWVRRGDTSRMEETNRFKRDWEYLYWFTKSKDGYYFDASKAEIGTSVLFFPPERVNKGEFKSIFPEGLVKAALEPTCPGKGTVLDPFCGTGTTGVVALRNGYYFVGIELIKQKIPLIKRRLDEIIVL
jgi:DNA modification methylase